MNKALELTVYPHWENGLDGTCYSDREGLDFPINVDYWILCKRLTDAELAAEWHYQDNRCGQVVEGYSIAHDGSPMASEDEEIERLAAVHRFATQPNYDEVAA